MHSSQCVSSCVDSSLAFAARNQATGASGHFRFDTHQSSGAAITFQGEVTCLVVVGKTAVLAGQITQDSSTVTPLIAFSAVVKDNGNPQGGVSPDSVVVKTYSGSDITFVPSPSDTDCILFGSITAIFITVPVADHGNVIVDDGT
jgi:hypothetical protein